MPSSLCRHFRQLEDLRLNGDVERRGRLVGDQQIGLVGERHGDHDALALSAGELMRIGVQPPFRRVEADLSQQLQHAGTHRGLVEPVVQLHDLADLLLDRVQRVERGHRLLEDDRDLLPAQLAHGVARRLEQVLAAIVDGAARMRGRGIGQQPQDRQRGDRLARARLADQGDDLALGNVEAHLLDGVDDGRSGGKPHRQIADVDERLGGLMCTLT